MSLLHTERKPSNSVIVLFSDLSQISRSRRFPSLTSRALRLCKDLQGMCQFRHLAQVASKSKELRASALSSANFW